MSEPLATIEVTDEDRKLFAEAETKMVGDDPAWRGGLPGLIWIMREAWVREGAGDTMPVDDFRTYARIKHYATDYGSGGWQTDVARWWRQLPKDLEDPQGGLF